MRPPPIEKPEREIPGISANDLRASDADRLAPGELREAPVGVAEVVARARRAPAQALEREQRDPVDDQEGRGELGGGEQFAQRVLRAAAR